MTSVVRPGAKGDQLRPLRTDTQRGTPWWDFVWGVSCGWGCYVRCQGFPFISGGEGAMPKGLHSRVTNLPNPATGLHDTQQHDTPTFTCIIVISHNIENIHESLSLSAWSLTYC